jgi:hypothetical protein
MLLSSGRVAGWIIFPAEFPLARQISEPVAVNGAAAGFFARVVAMTSGVLARLCGGAAYSDIASQKERPGGWSARPSSGGENELWDARTVPTPERRAPQAKQSSVPRPEPTMLQTGCRR